MSFQFRRRVDVREQSIQQEPFFQNSAPQNANTENFQQAQNYDPRFTGHMPQMSQQPFLQSNPGFYNPQQPVQQQNYNFSQAPYEQQIGSHQPQPQHPGIMQKEPYAVPLNTHNYHGHHPQFQGFPQHIPPTPNESRQNTQGSSNTNPMMFWNETQEISGFEEGESENSPVKLLVAVAGVVLIAAFSWFAYKWAKSPSSDIPPIIHAEPGPHKVSPDYRGGLNIPYQDKLIYNRIGDGNDDDPAERLLPPPEQPEINQHSEYNQDVMPPQQQQPMYSEIPSTQNQQFQQAPVQKPIYATNVTPSTQPQLHQQQPMNKTEEKVEDEEEPKKTKASENLNGKFFVQLATVKSEAAALREWKRLQAMYRLKGIKSQIKEYEMPDGEVVYRLLMGPFTEKVNALKHAVKIDGTKVVHMAD